MEKPKWKYEVKAENEYGQGHRYETGQVENVIEAVRTTDDTSNERDSEVTIIIRKRRNEKS